MNEKNPHDIAAHEVVGTWKRKNEPLIDLTLRVSAAIAAAEERGRRGGVEEAARWHEHRALTVELGLQRKVAVSLDGDDRKYIAKRITADRDDARWLRALNNESSACGPDCPGHPTGALAPRDSAPHGTYCTVEGCKRAYEPHSHAAPRDSGKGNT